MVTAGKVAQAPKAATERPVKIALALISLLLFCVGVFYLATACIPLAVLRNIIPTNDPEGLTAFTQDYYQYVRAPHYYEHVREKLAVFATLAFLLAALQLRFRPALTRGMEVCVADGYRMAGAIRQWRRGVSQAEWLRLSLLTALAGIIRFFISTSPCDLTRPPP